MSHIAKHNYSDSPEFKINIYFNKDKEVVKKKKNYDHPMFESEN